MKEAYMAIDAHARRGVLGLMDESGRYLDDWQFPTTESELIRHVAAVKVAHKRLAIEEGPLAYWIAQTIRAYVDDVFICDPRENALIGHSAHTGQNARPAQYPAPSARQPLGAVATKGGVRPNEVSRYRLTCAPEVRGAADSEFVCDGLAWRIREAGRVSAFGV